MFPLRTWAGFTAALVALVAIALISLNSFRQVRASRSQVIHTLDVLVNAEQLLSLLKDAETGQRGYLLAQDPSYLEPYLAAIQGIGPVLQHLRQLTEDNPGQQERLNRLDALIQGMLAELERALTLARSGDLAQALELVRTDEGKRLMDSARRLIEEMQLEERRLLALRTERLNRTAARSITIVLGGIGLLGALTLLAAIMTSRDFLALARAAQERQKYEERLEEQVRARTAELNEANAELEAFSYSVSHDLRAPLRAIDGFSQAVEDDPGNVLTERSRRFFQKVKAASGHMAELIDDLLDLSRLSRAEMVRERVNLTQLAREAIADLQAREPGRRVEVSIQEGLWAVGDRRLLRVVLDNLLGNAWKFTGKEPHPRIEVSCSHPQEESVFFVRDNGAGFDMAYAQKLFGPFQRMHSEQEFPGTGIGLATVHRIVRRHGGRIWAESRVGEGATIFFTLGGSDVHETRRHPAGG